MAEKDPNAKRRISTLPEDVIREIVDVRLNDEKTVKRESSQGPSDNNTTVRLVVWMHPPTESHMQIPEGPLVAAAEVFEESSEELRIKEAQMEEAITKRIMSAAVEANVVLPVAEEEKKAALPSKRVPLVAMSMVLLVIVALVAVVVVLLVTILPAREEPSTEEDAILVDHSSGAQFPPDDTVIAHVTTTLCYERTPLFGSSQLCPSDHQELGGAVTNLVAASRLRNFPLVDISIVNAGEVKTDIAPGPFTVADSKPLLPYHIETLVGMEITGQESIVALVRALQKLVDDYTLLKHDNNDETSISAGSYPYAAGLRYHVNMSQAFPNRLSYIGDNPQLAQDEWVPIDTAKIYRVVTNGYLVSGGDGFHEFNRLPPEDIQDTKVNVLSAFIEYCEAVKVLEEPPLEHFSTQSYVNQDYHWSCQCNDDEP